MMNTTTTTVSRSASSSFSGSSVASDVSLAVSSPFRRSSDINKAIQAGLIKPRCMSTVTLYNEQRPVSRPVLRNHWAAYCTGKDSVTEISVHVDGIVVRLWERDLAGVAFIAEVFNLGFDFSLLWTRFERDVNSGRAQLKDDSGVYCRYLSRANPSRKFQPLLARRDGICLMVKWLRRQERFIARQRDLLMAELREMGKAMGAMSGAGVGFADYDEGLLPDAQAARVAQAGAIRTEAVFRALLKRGSSMPIAKVSEVLDSAPPTLRLKQTKLEKREGNLRSGVGGRGQLDRYRRAPNAPNKTKESMVKLLTDMAQRQKTRAIEALNAGNIELFNQLEALYNETLGRAFALDPECKASNRLPAPPIEALSNGWTLVQERQKVVYQCPACAGKNATINDDTITCECGHSSKL